MYITTCMLCHFFSSGGRRVIILNSYEAIKEAFVKYAHAFSARPVVYFVKEITHGKGKMYQQCGIEAIYRAITN